MLPLYASLLLMGIFSGASTVNFDGVNPGSLPPYWTSTMTHPGRPPHWAVAPDGSAPSRHNVFAQLSSDLGRARLPMAIYDKVTCLDGDLTAKFKIIKGREAATAGVVWRFQDPNNYYYLQFSADQKTITFYRMQNGHAQAIPVIGGDSKVPGIAHEIRSDQWYIVRVLYTGSHVKVWFGNRRLFEAEDAGLLTNGKTGLWTKGDTVAYFDDFRIDKKS